MAEVLFDQSMLIASLLSEFYNANIAHAGIGNNSLHQLHRRGDGNNSFKTIGAVLIPVLVVLSGVFAGLTLGYMSLDETQLNVLASSGTPCVVHSINTIVTKDVLVLGNNKSMPKRLCLFAKMAIFFSSHCYLPIWW